MAETALAKKLKLKDGRAAVLKAPEGYLAELAPGREFATTLDGTFEWLQVFVTNKAELDAVMPQLVVALAPGALLWLTFPKGSSKVQSDLTRDRGWESVPEDRLRWVTLVSIDAKWSAFALRPYREGEERRLRFGGEDEANRRS
ncbi:MAG: hypothetical protein U0547_06535 [Dehalococcoidia bacterium]